MKQPRRISPRIPYEEAVSLTRADGGGRLFGRSVNLGVTGLYVKSLEPCEIGTELLCSVLLPGGPRKLHGRVVRIISLARGLGVGMAIAFLHLTDRDRLAIEQLIADHQRSVFKARLRLGGMEQPVKCEAVFDARTVHLTTELPFLRLDADVGVVLGDSQQLEASGVISRIALDPACEDGVPRLALDVHLGGPRDGQDYDDEDDDDALPPPTALPEPMRPPLPKVVVSRALRHEAASRARLYDRAPPPVIRRGHPTAEIARRPLQFLGWTPPPPLHARQPRRPARATEKVSARERRPAATTLRSIWRRLRAQPRWPFLLLVPPLAAGLAALLARAVG